MVGCFGGCFASTSSAVPPNHLELERAELKQLFNKSLELNKGRLIVHGIFARADTRNNNARVYPKHILKREVAKFEVEHIAKGTALGELDHPNYASRYFKCLNLPNISHQVLDVHWKGDCLWGTIEILPTPSGLLLWELYAQGIRLGVSSRGWASLRTDTAKRCVYVDDDFELITFDFVTEPSTRDAYLVPVRVSYKRAVPDQLKFVQMAHLGHGVVSMRNVSRMPDIAALVTRINQLQIKDAQYLDVEENARDYRAHLAMFALHAHLADKQNLGKRSDLNAILLQEITKHSFSAAYAGGTKDCVHDREWPIASDARVGSGNPHSVAVAAGMLQPAVNEQPSSSQGPQTSQQRPSRQGSRNRIHPSPGSDMPPSALYPPAVTQQQQQQQVPGPSGSVPVAPLISVTAAHELQLIRATLQRYAEVYLTHQAQLQARLQVNLPSKRVVAVGQLPSY